MIDRDEQVARILITSAFMGEQVRKLVGGIDFDGNDHDPAKPEDLTAILASLRYIVDRYDSEVHALEGALNGRAE